MALQFGSIAVSACLIFSLLCLLDRPAYAYVDPGSGLLAFQSLTAFVTGSLFFFRQKIKRLFRTKLTAESDSQALPDNHPNQKN
jgi:hypothetical protein